MCKPIISEVESKQKVINRRRRRGAFIPPINRIIMSAFSGSVSQSKKNDVLKIIRDMISVSNGLSAIYERDPTSHPLVSPLQATLTEASGM
jgi:hypothetical protein